MSETTRPTESERFWAKVNKNGPPPKERPDLGPCWLWTAHITTSTGYGDWAYGGRLNKVKTTPHRYAFETLVGEVPARLELDHLCRVRACCNPRHLEPVTHAENMRRGYGASGVNARRTHCKTGHEFTPENTYRNKQGGRNCRECMRANHHRWKARKRAERIAS